MIVNDRIYGKVKITDPLAIELIRASIFQRLKHISQMGVYQYAIPKINTTRYEHSIGTYYLLLKFNTSREEQIAGLLHDVSHTAFSHVIDSLLGDKLHQESQDKIHKTFILKSTIPKILKKHKMDVNLIANHHDWPLLDQHLPDLCADRLDYCLRDGVVCGVLKQKDVGRILKSLKIINSKWVFTNTKIAQKYFAKTLVMTRDWWAPTWGMLQFELMAQALRAGLNRKIITEVDLFTTDKEVWNKLKKSKNDEVTKNLKRVKNIFSLNYKIVHKVTSISVQGKYRAVDPLVQTNGKLKRASEHSPKYLLTRADKIKKEVESLRYVEMLE